jgi:hypothetical protein
MGLTNHKYPTVEIAICLTDHADHDNERAKIGDIIAVRKPLGQIGTKEMSRFLWLQIEGLEENEFVRLRESVYGESSKLYDKRRYCIPLERLKKLFPSLDVNRCKDPDDKYQPFEPMEEDKGYTLTFEPPLAVSGLVFDKETGEYL